MKFNGITIVSDMDGTLLTHDKKISDINKEAIKYFKQNGGTFTIASGRTYPKIKDYALEIGTDVPVISHNGGVIYDFSKDEVLYKRTLSKKAIKLFCDIMKRYPDSGYEIAGLSEVYFLKDNEMIQKHIKDENFTNLKWIKLDENVDFEMFKLLIADRKEKIDILEKEIPLIYSGYEFFRSDSIYYEVAPKGVSKGDALFALKDILKEKASKVYAVGDNMNDLEMIKAADVGVAVKNAMPNLKKEADFILPYSNDEFAIAHLIELLEKGRI